MEKTIKGIYELDCRWIANSIDAVGDHINGWVANVVCFDDHSCVGYATDNKLDSPSHLIIGSFVDGKGLSICKIHATNCAYDPIIFDAFSNIAGDKDSYYGEFLSKTIFNFYPMGIASIKAKKKEMNLEEVSKISAVYEDMSKSVKSVVGNPAYTLDMYQTMDYRDMANKLEIVAESVKAEPLSQEFFDNSGSQPNSGN